MASIREQSLIDIAKVMLPTNFIAKETDAKLLAYLNLSVAEINAMTPPTSYSLDNMPAAWDYIVVFGGSLYANLFLQVNYSLKDFSYSDYGLSLTVDRTGKLSPIYEKQMNAFQKMIWNLKKCELLKVLPMGAGTPRYQSQIGQFLKTCLSGDTLITLADNTALTLELLFKEKRTNFNIFSVDHLGNKVIGLADHVVCNGIREDMLRITFDCGTCLECTFDHLIFAEDGRQRRAIDLKIDDMLKSHAFTKIKVLGIEKISPKEVYDIHHVVEHSNFAISAGVFVHNCFGATFNWGTAPNG